MFPPGTLSRRRDSISIGSSVVCDRHSPVIHLHMSVLLRHESVETDLWPPWEVYATYDAARDDAAAALEAWRAAPSAAKRTAYAAYRAAADREDAAAGAWLHSCAAYDAAGRPLADSLICREIRVKRLAIGPAR